MARGPRRSEAETPELSSSSAGQLTLLHRVVSRNIGLPTSADPRYPGTRTRVTPDRCAGIQALAAWEQCSAKHRLKATTLTLGTRRSPTQTPKLGTDGRRVAPRSRFFHTQCSPSTRESKRMLVVLNWETFVALLIDMPHQAGVVMRMVVHRVRPPDPAHEPAHLAIN